ncbi:hypothetical protein FIV34_12175 [Luteibacter pinisoli]|uniref:Uncharacterized protein n=1 Tax=Luteibacter pinisoli TaxID=2589080 RepID=A0A4Y5Z695_9GAMM|nr:hypothetical protein [Luteibacter pinisoli]QDE39915.1 hypothetical protein FIV34_12175 [Luteibacter pinisoli]
MTHAHLARVERYFDATLVTEAALLAVAARFSGTHEATITDGREGVALTLVAVRPDAPDVESMLDEAVLIEALRDALRTARPSPAAVEKP